MSFSFVVEMPNGGSLGAAVASEKDLPLLPLRQPAVRSRYSAQSSARSDNFFPVIKIAQLRAGNINSADRASRDIPPQYVIDDGDILFSWSGSLECALWSGGPGALNQHLFKVTTDRYPRWLAYLAIQHHLDGFRHIAAGKATTMGHIQRHHLNEAKLAVPDDPALLISMTKVFEPIIERLWRRNVESRTLAEIRDALLPKLISGELRVKDAEKFVEAVA